MHGAGLFGFNSSECVGVRVGEGGEYGLWDQEGPLALRKREWVCMGNGIWGGQEHGVFSRQCIGTQASRQEGRNRQGLFLPPVKGFLLLFFLRSVYIRGTFIPPIQYTLSVFPSVLLNRTANGRP